MSSRKCCLCSKIIESETADILTMGGYGIPRYLCEECAGDLNTVTRGATSADIHAAMDRLGKKMSVSGVEDKLTIKTINDIFKSSDERADKIDDGTYDFSLDEEELKEDELDELPPELEETEEDRELDAKDEERSKKFDKIMNWFCAAVFIGAIAYLLYYFLG